MNLQFYHEKLSASEAFKKFKQENSDAFLIAGFFVIDLSGGKQIQQLDYFLPKDRKIAAFILDKKVELKMVDALGAKDGKEIAPVEMSPESKIDLDMLKGILQDEMKNHIVTDKLSKVIAVLQVIDGKKTWFLNCITTSMSIIKVHIDDKSKSVLKFEKANIMDFVKTVKGPMQKQKSSKSKKEVPKGKTPLNGKKIPKEMVELGISDKQTNNKDIPEYVE